MITVIIITKNAEITLADCISNIQPIADQLIVVDSGSTDRTVEIAKINRAEVFTRTMDDFASQRNFAMEKAKGEWVLYLDSDEFATKRFCEEVKRTITEHDPKSGINGYFIHRKTYYLGKDWGFTDAVQRLFLKNSFKKWEGVVHETPRIEGQFGYISAPVHHFTHQNLSQMLTKTIEWSDHEAQLRFNAKHPTMTPVRFFRVMATGFLESYFKGKGYKNGTEGFIEAIYQSYSMFVTYAKLWEKQHK
ncbi:MAG TPA: glycosyltransferase family 2 protein [Candidatus Woesebacteria bacterium]|nr:glycosyltransferase family 2 protein [Candidatus Woesebacteria bacterium]